MGKTIDLNDRKEYRFRVSEVVDSLYDIEDQLLTDMMDLAFLDKWKTWIDKQEQGITTRFDEHELTQIDDESINKIAELKALMEETREFLKQKNQL